MKAAVRHEYRIFPRSGRVGFRTSAWIPFGEVGLAHKADSSSNEL